MLSDKLMTVDDVSVIIRHVSTQGKKIVMTFSGRDGDIIVTSHEDNRLSVYDPLGNHEDVSNPRQLIKAILKVARGIAYDRRREGLGSA